MADTYYEYSTTQVIWGVHLKIFIYLIKQIINNISQIMATSQKGLNICQINQIEVNLEANEVTYQFIYRNLINMDI